MDGLLGGLLGAVAGDDGADARGAGGGVLQGALDRLRGRLAQEIAIPSARRRSSRLLPVKGPRIWIGAAGARAPGAGAVDGHGVGVDGRVVAGHGVELDDVAGTQREHVVEGEVGVADLGAQVDGDLAQPGAHGGRGARVVGEAGGLVGAGEGGRDGEAP